MPIDSIIHTNRHSIDRVLNAGVPVALVFWEPSRPLPGNLNGKLEELAMQYAGKALIAKVNARDETDLRSRFHVADTPAVVYVKNGQELERTQPLQDAASARAWLEHMISGAPRPTIAATRDASAPANANGASSAGRAGQSAAPVTLTDANFAQTISGDLPVLVDFWAPWCGPCRMVAPSVEQLAREFAGRAVVGKLNVDDNRTTAGRYNIMSIPSLLIFERGVVVDQIVGAQPLEVLRQRLARYV